MRRLALLALLFAFAAATSAELPEGVRAGLMEAGIPEDAIGVLLQRVPDGKVVLAHRETQGMAPGSTLKLLTSIVALDRLGPAYRARTQLRTNAEVKDGVLQGDLVLQGGGDAEFDWRAFERQLSQLRVRGIREIAGDLVLDLSRFRPARTDIGLDPFDEAPEFRYNVVPDALLLNMYLVQVDIASTGSSVRMAPTPALAGVTFVSEFELVEASCDDWEDGWKPPAAVQDRRGTITVRLRGTFPKDCAASTSINVLDRVVYADRLFRALWSRMGGRFRGRTREGTAPPDTRLLAQHLSRPLAEIAREAMKSSDNPMTRVMYLNIGAASSRDGDLPTARRAEGEVRAWLSDHGIEAKGLVLDNGSGLSRAERIAPVELAATLKAGLSSRWAPEFLAAFPIVALDGTMRLRLKDSPAAGRARIKTGTLRDASAVAGYVEDASGRMHVVVAMINHPLAHHRVARPILDSLLDWVARQ
jgi:serine-type D-Ala-D-Ala carboxypeptidase/endopeptidase (penicillin-binding protein 4)